ncbi:nucleotide exchange factor GrpE [Coxiella endosymbiont of Amblyomma sculptum]|uniref:nucleotide exchange factor GrpE n=1 Tax=Coxiella endosymbiont of Amblyomma sculptum TaxID=2487929 RepID=UPI00132E7523|nr:nucleotide exchange factor GrpE [Coxiella endosymbiont of Amblyomma sculptum]QHG92509.1 nucleotide exchange factor GrpE [Coxiella endosymbiont of Amblyomma sculptum]
MNTKEQSEFENESNNNNSTVGKVFQEDKAIKMESDAIQEIGQHKEKLEKTDHEKAETPEIKVPEIKVVDLVKQLDEYKTQYMRLQAKMDNLRKRTEREIANTIKYAVEKLVMDLLPVVDSLTHGLESQKLTDLHSESLREGMKLTLDLLHKIFEKHGVGTISPTLGDLFNPELHEAVAVQNIPDTERDTIVQIVQKGYQLNGRVLRAARVVVSTS